MVQRLDRFPGSKAVLFLQFEALQRSLLPMLQCRIGHRLLETLLEWASQPIDDFMLLDIAVLQVPRNMLVFEAVAECLLLLILTEHPSAQSIHYDWFEQTDALRRRPRDSCDGP
ncbi:MAG: hypothetical protein WAW16_03040 [Candidatus Cryosericum sp.]